MSSRVGLEVFCGAVQSATVWRRRSDSIIDPSV